jgi:PPP family 3-phenylpropionic acid transporter
MILKDRGASLLQLEVPLALFYLFYFALVGVYIIFMPKVLLSFEYNNSEVGIIYAAAPFMRFLIPFIFRRYVALDHKIFILSLILTFISSIIFITTIESFWLYLATNLLFGASMGIVLPYVETISLQKLSKSRYGKVRLYGSIGFMVIALWLGKILSSPYETLYYLSSMAFLTLVFGIIVAYYDSDTKLTTTEDNSSFKLANHPWFWMSVFLMQVGFGGYYSFFTIYETSHGVSLEIVSWMWSFGVVCEIVMLYFQGPLLQRNLLTILKLSILITAFRWLLLFLYPDSTTMIFVSQSLHPIRFALYHTASISYVFTIYTQKKLAQQFFLGIAFGLGGSVGAILAGQIYGESMFLVESIITLLAFFTLMLHNNRRENKHLAKLK